MERIRGSAAIRTPLVPFQSSAFLIKAESLQVVGSFKLRGALNIMLGLSEEELRCGVVTSSSGNHGRAVAYVAHMLRTKAVIVMPATARQSKVKATRALGAEVVFVDSIEHAQPKACELEAQRGLIRIPPFDDARIIAATGTIALEILEEVPKIDTITVPIGGGGLIAGIATAIKALQPSTKVIGVEPENSAAAHKSFIAGRLVTLDPGEGQASIAEGLVIDRIGILPWQHIQAFVDDVLTVSEVEIASAMSEVSSTARLVVEPSGAVPIAAWLYRKGTYSSSGVHVAIASGGNIDLAMSSVAG